MMRNFPRIMVIGGKILSWLIMVLTGHPPDRIETDPVVRKKNNSNRFGIRTLELTIKVKNISIFVKRVIYDVVHSTIQFLGRFKTFFK